MKSKSKNGSVKSVRATSTPKFPYTTKPNSLRRFLQEIPKKPKPPKFDSALFQSWGFRDTNDLSILRVLRSLGMVDTNNSPTDLYSEFMKLGVGPKALAGPIKRIYDPLFTASHEPFRENSESLQNLFNIHSGGGERTLDQQIQTFKALCENTDFIAVSSVSPAPSTTGAPSTSAVPIVANTGGASPAAAININVHIHLPENKGRRDYEYIIEDIARYIFGRGETAPRD